MNASQKQTRNKRMDKHSNNYRLNKPTQKSKKTPIKKHQDYQAKQKKKQNTTTNKTNQTRQNNKQQQKKPNNKKNKRVKKNDQTKQKNKQTNMQNKQTIKQNKQSKHKLSINQNSIGPRLRSIRTTYSLVKSSKESPAMGTKESCKVAMMFLF